MAATETEALKLLAGLGFNETEAIVYCELLRSPGSTGYRVAQSIGKAQASAYAALAALEAKGAVIFDSSGAKAYRAVSPRELLGRIRASLDDRCARAEAMLSDIEVPAADDRIYQLRNREQVYQRVRTMLQEARETILFELFPEPMAELRQDLLAAASRGVKVAGLVLRAEEMQPELGTVLSRRGEQVYQTWPGDQVTVISDAEEFLIALIERDSGDVRHGMWSRSLYLSCLFHNGIVSDVVLHGHDALKDIGSPNRTLFGGFPPGVRQFLHADGAPGGK